jgi:hypothetical protein
MDTGRSTGGIFWLRELIEEHASEIAFDFRSQFGLSYLSIGREVTWGEAIRLASRLFSLTDSHLQAAVSGWEYPVSQEWIVLSHVYDLLAAVNSKNKPKPSKSLVAAFSLSYFDNLSKLYGRPFALKTIRISSSANSNLISLGKVYHGKHHRYLWERNKYSFQWKAFNV